MKAKLFTALILSVMALSTPARAQAGAEGALSAGVVDFHTIIEESKYGKEGQNQLEAMRNQITHTVEEAERELKGMENKLRDPDYLDSLSPEAEEQLKTKYQTLSQEMMRQQQQFYQIMSQGEMRLMQEINTHVMRASAIVAKARSLEMIYREEALFFFLPAYNITDAVIAEMDKLFAQEMKDHDKKGAK